MGAHDNAGKSVFSDYIMGYQSTILSLMHYPFGRQLIKVKPVFPRRSGILGEIDRRGQRERRRRQRQRQGQQVAHAAAQGVPAVE